MMAELQKVDVNNTKTFDELCQNICYKIVALLKICLEVHIIFDRYDDELSPKSLEHDKRYGGNASKLYEVVASRPLPDWKLFMSSNDNKQNLNKFICESIEKFAQTCKLLKNHPEKKIYLAGGYAERNITKILSSSGAIIEEKLSSNHSEADTRIILHALHASKSTRGKKNIFVRSPDTDVLVLLVSFYSQMSKTTCLWFETGVVTRNTDLRRFIPVHLIYKNIGKILAVTLPCLHALTGCDVVSSFHLIGKTKMYAAAKKTESTTLQELQKLYTGLCNEAEISIARGFVALLYDPKKSHGDKHHCLNSLRAALATSKTYSGIEKLPPSEPAFLQHVKRTIWQAHTWNHAGKNNIPVLNVLNYGWEVCEDKLECVLYEGLTSIELLQEYFCNCGKKISCKNSDTCKCTLNGMKCCEVCTCNKNKCSNHHEQE